MDLSLNKEIIESLHNKHYAVVDGFLPLNLANQLLQDANTLETKNRFQQHYFQFGGSLLKKPNVYEMDLSDPKDKLDETDLGGWKNVVSEVGPKFVQQMDELDQESSSTSKNRIAPLSLQTQTPPAIKLQLNKGGGSFPWHYDNPGPPNQRSLTCVVYLNPDWNEGDGGEIVLWPFLSQSIKIPPLHQRAVLFYSDRILHRVLPSNIRRVCFTMWCNGKEVNAKRDTILSKDQLKFTSYDEAQLFFARSPLQRVISRAVYSEEYLTSLLECLVVGGNVDGDDSVEGVTKEEEEKLTKQHEASVMGILSKLRPLIDEFRRRKQSLESG